MRSRVNDFAAVPHGAGTKPKTSMSAARQEAGRVFRRILSSHGCGDTERKRAEATHSLARNQAPSAGFRSSLDGRMPKKQRFEPSGYFPGWSATVLGAK